MTIPVIKMEFAPVKGGFIPRTWHVPYTTQRVEIETPFGNYVALVRVIVAREAVQIEEIWKKD